MQRTLGLLCSYGRHALTWVGPCLLAACASLPDAPGPRPVHEPTLARPIASARTAPDARLTRLVAQQDRIYRVAAPLIVKNAVLCKTSARPLLGFTAKNKYSFAPELQSASESTLKLDQRLQVMHVLGGSGAQRAGIRPGDILQTIQGQSVPQGPQAENEAAKLVSPLLKNSNELEVVVLRADQPITLQLSLTLACAFAVEVGHAAHVNAYADGRRIMLTQGLLDFLGSDEELASILAREMAHNVHRHAARMKLSSTVSGVIDGLLPLNPDASAFAGSAGLRAYEEKFDQEADRLALFMLVRAGYKPEAALSSLQKLASSHPPSSLNSYSALHPWTEERASLMRATIAELKQKQSSKKPLIP